MDTKPGILLAQKQIFRVLGFRFTSADSIWWKLFAWFYPISLFIIVVPEINFVVANISDVSLATSALCTILYCYCSLPKMITMMKRRNRFYGFWGNLNELWDNGKRNLVLIIY